MALIERVFTSLSLVVIICCYSENQVVGESVNGLHMSRPIIKSYFARQNPKVFEYVEEPNRISHERSLIDSEENDEDGKISIFPFDFLRLMPELCRVLQTELAKNSASFVQCAMLNARPITICLKCVGSYNKTVYSYNQLMDASENDTKCRDVLAGRDKLEIIETMYGSVVKMWNRGNCNSCYDTDEHGSPNLSVISNETLDFMQALKKVLDCFEGIKLAGGSNDTCTDCKLLYENLGSIYDGISKDMVNNQTEVVCADITDAMNVTHHIWNSQLKCKLFGTGVGYALFILTGCLSATPILFYLAAKILSNVETIHLVLPKRKQFVQDSTQLQM